MQNIIHGLGVRVVQSTRQFLHRLVRNEAFRALRHRAAHVHIGREIRIVGR